MGFCIELTKTETFSGLSFSTTEGEWYNNPELQSALISVLPEIDDPYLIVGYLKQDGFIKLCAKLSEDEDYEVFRKLSKQKDSDYRTYKITLS